LTSEKQLTTELHIFDKLKKYDENAIEIFKKREKDLKYMTFQCGMDAALHRPPLRTFDYVGSMKTVVYRRRFVSSMSMLMDDATLHSQHPPSSSIAHFLVICMD